MRSAGGGQPGRKKSTFTTSCTGSTVEQHRDDRRAAMHRAEVPVLAYARLQQWPRAERVPQRCDVARHRAVAQRDQQLRPRTYRADDVQVLIVCDRALDQDHVHVLQGTPCRRRSGCRRVDVSARSSSRSSMSRNDMWQPEQPPSQTVASRRALSSLFLVLIVHSEVGQERPLLLLHLGDVRPLSNSAPGRARLHALAAARARRRLAPRLVQVGR